MRKVTDKWLFTIDNDGYQVVVISGDTVTNLGHVITDSFVTSLKGVIYMAEHHYLHYYRALLCDVQVVGSEGDYSLVGHVRFMERH